MDFREKLSLVKNHPAFSRLNLETLRDLAQIVTCHRYTRNQAVYVEFEIQSTVYVVKGGEFNMSKRVLQYNKVFNYLTKWKYYEICILERGETFGMELYDSEPLGFHKYSVKCHTVDGILYALSLQQIQQVLTKHYLKLSVGSLFSYQTQLTKNRLYLQRESQMNNLYCNISQPLKHARVKNSPHRSISCDISYCDKIQSLINYQKEVLDNPKRIIKTEVLEDDSYVNQSVNKHIRALKPFITDFETQKHKQRYSIQSVDRIDDLSRNEKLFKLKVLQRLGVRPKKKLQITIHQLQSQHLQRMFPFNPQ